MNFVLGLDLDGVCADFYGRMREIVAELHEVPIDSLPGQVSFGLAEWGVDGVEEYRRIHRFAVTQRKLFDSMKPIPGAVPALRRLSNEGIHIRIITHRLFIPHFHQIAVTQTTTWLDRHGFLYHDLCFMKDKDLVDADLYVEDAEQNILRLQEQGKPVITFTNSTNVHTAAKRRAGSWQEAEAMIRETYYEYRSRSNLPLPSGPGKEPPSGST